MFAYCGNDPVNNEDPNGDVAWWVGAAVGGSILGSAGYLFDTRNGGFSWSGLGKAAALGAISGVALGGAGKYIAKGVKALVSVRKAKALAQTVSKYDDITSAGSRYMNKSTDVTMKKFGDNLSSNGWSKSLSKDRKTTVYSKNGAKYVLRGNSKYTGRATADYYKAGSKKINIKIRLGD
jgi:hypothetical protein